MASALSAVPSVHELEGIARSLRRHIVRMIAAANSGHPGGSLSAVEIITALYFGGVLRHDPKRPDWPDRDRFILSKGHGVPAQYAALAESGYFPVSELTTLRQVNSRLQGHPVQGSLPGIEASTGSLGQGLSIGIGHAIAARLDGRHYRTYVLLGDGECQEGQVWEAALTAPNYELSTLTAIVDVNRYQLDGAVEDINSLEPFADKWRAYRWHVLVIDGHDLVAVLNALHDAREPRDVPTCILARTVKGKGVTFMENNNEFHGKAPNKEQLEVALSQLEE
ncbi:MAG TPA: transketolase [Gemmatimonadaceae bacterium]|nr:transketolase [Gemmatimonadaceae bacterium]